MMRKTALFWYCAVLLVTSLPPAWAAPIGRPIAREKSWTVGGLLAIDKIDVENRAFGLTGDLSTNQYLVDVGYGFSSGGEFFLRLGVADEEYNRGSGQRNDLGTGASWGLGLRGTLYNSYESWKILGDLQYNARPGRDVTNAELDIRELQTSLGLEIKSGPFAPYGGLMYHKVDLKTNNPSAFPDAKISNQIGAYLGVGIEPYENWAGYLEGRFSSGASATVGVQYRF